MFGLAPASGRSVIIEQQPELVLLMAERYLRATSGHEAWAIRAKECVEFMEGRQWNTEALKALESMDRPALTFNKIAPLVRMVLGYHRNNRTDAKYLPGHDGSGSQQVADALTQIAKQVSELNQEPYVSAEVFLDGIITGRGFYDTRLNFEENYLGDCRIRAKDPFSLKLDPDGDTYDLNDSCAYIIEDRWVSIDEVEYTYGEDMAQLLQPLVNNSGYSGMPSSVYPYVEEITPWRKFGGEFDRSFNQYAAIEAYLSNAYDTARKNIRLVDCQHYQRTRRDVIIDQEVGAVIKIPRTWNRDRIMKLMAWNEYKFERMGKASPLRLSTKLCKEVRWTTMVGDIVVQDQWSPYDDYTFTSFFPYFRRGETKGMVDDLIDPQKEINKRRSAQVDITTRMPHSGWQYHALGLKPEMKAKLESKGAQPGINIEWQGDPHMKPEQIQSSPPPTAMERLENKSADDLKEISGINDSMMGQIDRVQSGRAIEARNRQGVLSIQSYMDNNSRTQELLARKKLNIFQKHYTEQRTSRILGDNGKLNSITINQEDPVTQVIHNDVTLGRYTVSIDETPLSQSFLAAQYEELIELIDKGILPVELVGDIAVDVSSMPRKDEIKQRIQQFQAAQMGGQPGAQPPQGQPVPQPGGTQPGQSITQDVRGNQVGPVGPVPKR